LALLVVLMKFITIMGRKPEDTHPRKILTDIKIGVTVPGERRGRIRGVRDQG
jgi:hypothetical protein